VAGFLTLPQTHWAREEVRLSMTESEGNHDRINRVECRRPVTRLERKQLWELMWRHSLVEHWLGTGSSLAARVGQPLVVADRSGVRRTGLVRHVSPGESIEASLTSPGRGGQGVIPGELRITITERPQGGLEVCIAEAGDDVDSQREEIQAYWDTVLDRLSQLIQRVCKRRDEPSQAVIVIHGIGEQEPGATLRSLVASGLFTSEDRNERVNETSYVKPDRVTGSFELRTVMFDPTPNQGEPTNPTTDVYELYWAHLMRDTTVGQVLDWFRRLLVRRKVPGPLKPLWGAIWLTIAVVLGGGAAHLLGLWHPPRWLQAGGAFTVVVVIFWRMVGKGIVVSVIGDAARYLSPRPGNVASRQAIRQAGVDLLEALHERGRYDRIVVLGHSLGSVIAYDVITYGWLAMHAKHRRPQKPYFGPLRAIERATTDNVSAETAQNLQHAAWQQTRRNTQPWLVTDLVTVGSPLAYADFLMATSKPKFIADQHDEVLPTCPPQTQLRGQQQRCSYEKDYYTPSGKKTFTMFDHGAPFAVTRWTNMFFRTRWGGLVGDIVGGPVSTQFGTWVRDIPLTSPVRRFSHTWYWRPRHDDKPKRARCDRRGKRVGDDHLTQLRDALQLSTWRELRELGNEIPAYVIAERIVGSGRPH
jgi:uncharacterized protein YndB with AHSA1/START domain/pimeloyl-ACP methyl ester carboxylesterase